VIGKGEGVIPCRRGDHAELALLWGEGQKGVARAALLERARGLLPLVLEVDVHAGDGAQGFALGASGAHHARADAEMGGGDVFEEGEFQAVHHHPRDDGAAEAVLGPLRVLLFRHRPCGSVGILDRALGAAPAPAKRAPMGALVELAVAFSVGEG